MTKYYLEVTTWTYITELARHYYGLLRPDLNSYHSPINLEHPISAKEAKRRNKEDGFVVWRPGDLTRGFDSLEEVKQAAIVKFNEISSNGDLLLYGNYASADPMQVLAGPEDLREKLNKIYEEFDSINGWEGGKETRNRAKEICKLWDETLP